MATPDYLARPTYTPSQLLAFYTHISLPATHRHDPGATSRSVARGPAPTALAYLTALQKHTLCAVPFENLDLHYSPSHTNSIDPHTVYAKIITRKAGRGGYCMENNSFLGTTLRSLGFDVFPTGGRVNEAVGSPGKRAVYGGFNHEVNIVTLADGQRYLVDVGFGGAAASTAPMPLVDGYTAAQIEPQTLRLRFTNIPDNTSVEAKMWVLEVQNAPGEDWGPVYCFNEMVEFLPADFRLINYFTSTSPTSWFTYTIVVTRVLMGEDGEVEGSYVLNRNEVKKRVNGKSEVLRVCKDEGDRVDALREYFGIKLSEAEVQGIRGLVTEL